MRKTAATTLLCLAALSAAAQLKKVDEIKKSLETTNKDTTAWTYGGVFNIGTNEGFLHNWAAGGELASFTVNGLFSGHLEHLNHKDVWSNNLDLAYGLNYAYSTSFIPHKTDDRIDFTSKYGTPIDTANNIYLSTLFNFKSQFTKGYNYSLTDWQKTPTSTFLSPAYFTLAVGAEYRKGSDISLFLSPIAGRLTLVDRYYTLLSTNGAFGVPYGKTSKYELGAYFSGRYVWNIKKGMTFKTRVDLYSNYLAKNRKDTSGVVIKDNPGNITVLFDNLFDYKISRHMNIALGVTFMYDNNIPYSTTRIDKTTGATVNKNEPAQGLGWLQMNQVFTLGLEYKF